MVYTLPVTSAPNIQSSSDSEATALWNQFQQWLQEESNDFPGLGRFLYNAYFPSTQPSSLAGVKQAIQNLLNASVSVDGDGPMDLYAYMGVMNALTGGGVVRPFVNPIEILQNMVRGLNATAASYGDSRGFQIPAVSGMDQAIANVVQALDANPDHLPLYICFMEQVETWGTIPGDVQSWMNNQWQNVETDGMGQLIEDFSLQQVNDLFAVMGYTPPAYFPNIYQLIQLDLPSPVAESFINDLLTQIGSDIAAGQNPNPQTLFNNMVYTNPPSAFFNKYPGLDLGSMQAICQADSTDAGFYQAYAMTYDYMQTLNPQSADYTYLSSMLSGYNNVANFSYPYTLSFPGGPSYTFNSPLQFLKFALQNEMPPSGVSSATRAFLQSIENLPSI